MRKKIVFNVLEVFGMKLIRRKINLESDKDYVLERHCRISYESDCPWKREMSYEDYRAEWFSLQGQTNGFLDALAESMNDARAIAEIIENESNEIIAFLWVSFFEDVESGFCFADVQDIYVEDKFRTMGIASLLMKYAEDKARESGAKVIRSGTGCENVKSIGLHEKLGYYQYRYEFEKLL